MSWISMDFRGRTFTRSQLAAVSSIFMDFHDFHGISKDFIGFLEFQGSGVGAGCYFIDLDFDNFHKFSSIFMIFIRFHKISWDFMRFHGFQGSGVGAGW